MPEYEVLNRLRHNGKEYGPGDTVDLADEPHALRTLGVVGAEIEPASVRADAKADPKTEAEPAPAKADAKVKADVKADAKARAEAKADAEPAAQAQAPGGTDAKAGA